MLLETADQVLDTLPASEAPTSSPEPAKHAAAASARVRAAPGAEPEREIPEAQARIPDAGLAASAGRTKPRPRSTFQVIRSSGGLLTVAAGPVAGLIAWRIAGMGAMESFSLAFLVSVWIGPKIMSGDWT